MKDRRLCFNSLPPGQVYGGVLADEGEMIAAAQFADRVGLPFHLLGGGSNCLLAEEIDAVNYSVSKGGATAARELIIANREVRVGLV
ncbi:hypothetical protein JMK10_00340 [Rhodovulum sulfidophilum]|uniref:hypothetical protein n=1 Tax=Rhodovulum sulfidophilum TaxID=35806 RepID=UPI001F1CFB09|nr:hypothetical protein [Rhodovulum sulfidophilum]MCF4115310.1 hypothetical protein [Rhodovulum sulfidophilum]